MNADVIERLTASSDAYSSKLWSRFYDNNPFSAKEAELFSGLHDKYKRDELAPEVIPELLSDPRLSKLAGALFSPGATDDVFINVHSAFLNGWRHSHDFFEIIYVASGDAVDRIDGAEVRLNTRELCIHNPKATHEIVKMDAQKDLVINVLLPAHIFRRSFYSLLMENKELDRFFNNYMLSGDMSPNFMAFHNTSDRVDIIMELLCEEFLRGKNSSRFVMESTLVVLFGELMRSFKSDPFMRELVAYVTDNLQSANMTEAAAKFGYHKNYFPHVIRKHTSRTFWELVTELRIQRAANLLIFTEDTVEEISESVGYKSTASFYEHFFKKYGTTPNAFRKDKSDSSGSEGADWAQYAVAGQLAVKTVAKAAGLITAEEL